jgi:uncharacterized protein YndB with AHSA1/START domain
VTHQPDISDDEVLKATGRSWSEWLALIGGSSVAKASHDDILVFLREQHGVPGWWQRAIATAYEQSIGRISESETDDGFQAEVSQVVNLPRDLVFQAWIDGELRAKWLRHGDFEPSMVRSPDTVRGQWMPSCSRVDITVAESGEGKCELTILHRKLASDSAAGEMKTFWTKSIDRLVERIGSNR